MDQEPTSPAVQVVRVLALGVSVLGILQALRLLAWYASAHAIGPTKTWHVVTVGVGWLLFQLSFALAVLHTLADWQAIPGFRAALGLAGELFVMAGTWLLFLSAKRRARRLRA